MQLRLNACLRLMMVLGLSLAFTVSAQDPENKEESSVQAGMQYWNGIDKEAIKTESGLQYKILVEGRGRKPKPKSTVKVHYRGILLDGTGFDNSYSSDEPIELSLHRVIEGWNEGLQLMPSGSAYVFLIPPELAYGEKGARSIPPNSTLIFEIELFHR
jgi:FKBP-type peptidyl-prolyl cis-trans isomerase FkpA